jgi:uncharacterized glyoxalase superfamily protein PhnB
MDEPIEVKISNRSMPPSSVIPVLSCRDFEATISWLCENFGFHERWRVGDHRAQLTLGNSTIVISRQATDLEIHNSAMMVRVDDVMEHFKKLRDKGVTVLRAPQVFPYGEMQYTVEDIDGTVWTFSESVKDVLPEEWGGVSSNLD